MKLRSYLGGVLRALVSAEARSTLRSPATWLVDALGGGKSDAGVNVNETTALELSVYFACVRNIAEDVAKLPFKVYRSLKPRGKEPNPQHPAWRLLHDAPNDEMTAYTFRETITHHCLGWGNGYAEIVRLGSGRPSALFPLHPTSVTPGRDSQNAIIYEVRDEARQEPRTLRAEQVLHIHGLGFDGLVGYSPIEVAKNSVGVALAQQKYRGKFFGNGGRPGGVLEVPGVLKDEAHKRLKESWADKHGGADNAHRPAILEQGVTWKESSINPEDAQMIESGQFSVEEICRWFRMPPHKVQHLIRATFSNIEHQSIEYVTDTLMPWLVRWEQEVRRKMFLPGESDLYAEHVVDGLLRGDTASRYQSHSIGRQWGWLSVDDIREKENMNPLPDGQGEVYLIPQNMIPADKAGELGPSKPAPTAPPPDPDEDTEPAEEDDRSAFLPLLEGVYARLLHVEHDKASRAMKRGDATEWAGGFYPDHQRHAATMLAEVVAAMGVGHPQTVASALAMQHTADSLTAIQSGELWPDDRAHRSAAETLAQLTTGAN